jgi:hypothetical protein
MHGGSLTRETVPAFARTLREEPFAFQVKVGESRARRLSMLPRMFGGRPSRA